MNRRASVTGAAEALPAGLPETRLILPPKFALRMIALIDEKANNEYVTRHDQELWFARDGIDQWHVMTRRFNSPDLVSVDSYQASAVEFLDRLAYAITGREA